MSKRPEWWSNVRSMIYAYPKRRKRLDELRRTSVTPQYGAAGGHGGDPGDPVHAAVARQLPPQQQRELEAVEQALAATAALPNGALYVKIIELYYFRRGYTLQGAGQAVHYERRQTYRIHGRFVRLVAQNIGYID